jgi:ribosomal protein L11 methyltransferase
MNWICLRADLDSLPDDFSPLHEVFAAHGLDATVEHDDPPGMSAYFCEDETANQRIADLGEALMAFGAQRIVVAQVPEEDWAESWKQFFKPREIGRGFMVKPSWEESTATDRTVIDLDPGQAFGTGEHATTQLCLSMLEEAVEPGDSVIDIGCGSGILAIAAAKLGAQVVATEIDPAAAQIAAENAARNGVRIEVLVADGLPAGLAAADVAVSNIVSATLIRLAPAVARLTKEGGIWIASGIIPANLPDVLSAAESAGFSEVSRREEGGWVGVCFRREPLGASNE